MNIQELEKKAHAIRKDVVTVAVRNKAGHIAPSLSTVDYLVALYYQVLNRSQDPTWPERDRVVFSKAHGCYALYSILADIGYVKREDWDAFYQGSFLAGCVERRVECGIEASCGSLGHGLPQAVGIAWGAKLQGLSFRTYCVMGDGELQEGSNWEALQFAVKFGLSNLTIIIDRNNLQAMDFLEEVLTLKNRKDDLDQKFSGFGCLVQSCDGHSMTALVNQLEDWAQNQDKLERPQVLLANTIKGYGLYCMENKPMFHFRLPTPEELQMGNRYDEKP